MLTLVLLLAGLILFTACSRNYYSGNGRGGRGCGCPSTR